MKGGTILIGLFLVFCLFFGYQYNSVKSARLNVDAAYGQVENQMQRRADLIPNLVNTVKGYMKHEEAQIKAVTDARARLMNAGSPEELGAADAELTGALGKLIAIAENYPDLKANTQFTELMREISGTENRIAVARMDYNEAIRFYNIKIQTFPGGGEGEGSPAGRILSRCSNWLEKEDHYGSHQGSNGRSRRRHGRSVERIPLL